MRLTSPFLLEVLAPPQEEAPGEIVPQLAALWQRLSPSARRQVERALVVHLVETGVRDRSRLASAVASLRHPAQGKGSAEAELLPPVEPEAEAGECQCAHAREADAAAELDEAYDAGESGESLDEEETDQAAQEAAESIEDTEGVDEADVDATAEDETEAQEECETGAGESEEEDGTDHEGDDEAAGPATLEAEDLAGWDEVFGDERSEDEEEQEEEDDLEGLEAGEPELDSEVPTPAEIEASLKAVKVSSTTAYLRRAPNPFDLNRIASKNTPSKRAVFKALQRTWLSLRTVERRLAGGSRGSGAQKKLQDRRATLIEELEKRARALKEWLQANALGHSRALAQAGKEIAKQKALLAKLSGTKSFAQAEAVRAKLASAEKAAQALADDLRAGARGYEPLKDFPQKTHEVRVPSPSGEVLVRLHDHVIAFATDTPGGLDGNADGDRPAGVDTALARSGISEDKRAILRVLSSLEGRFSTVNTWDRAVITFGFTQWTTDAGGDGTLCDLMEAVRAASPDAYRRCFQRYGLDVERTRGKGRHFTVTLADGSVLRAGPAARRVQTSVPHVAVLSAAGMDPDVQTAQIKFAADKKIDAMLAHKVSARGKAARLGELLTSVYAVGVVTDRAAGTGEYGTRDAAQRGFEAYFRAHPDADLTRDADRQAAGTRVLAALEALDRERASKYASLSAQPGSFSA